MDTQEEATENINIIKKEYSDAKHNVYAYKIAGKSLICKYSDDGEPQGTAGSAIMGLIERMNLQNILIVVTRYFGGILLGTGGLVKAYTESAKRGIEDGIIIEKIETIKTEIELKYDLKDIVCSYLERNTYDIKAIYFGETVKIIVNVNKAEFDKFYRNIEEITEGRSKVQKE